jgi:hypothetical protein
MDGSTTFDRILNFISANPMSLIWILLVAVAGSWVGFILAALCSRK